MNWYKSERRLLHQSIITSLFQDKKESHQPQLLVLGGGMLVGKTGIRKILLGKALEYEKLSIPTHPRLDLHETIILDPTVFSPLPEFEEHRQEQHPEKLPCLVEEYYDLCTEIAEMAAQRAISLLFPDHADHLERITEIANSAKQQGMTTILVALGMDPIKHLVVTEDLHSRGFGREVDDQKALAWLLGFQSNWETLKEIFQKAVLFETTGVISLIAFKEALQTLCVVDPVKYQDFLDINRDFKEVLESQGDLTALVSKRDREKVKHVQATDVVDNQVPALPLFKDQHDVWPLLKSQFLVWLYQESLRQRVKHKETKA